MPSNEHRRNEGSERHNSKPKGGQSWSAWVDSPFGIVLLLPTAVVVVVTETAAIRIISDEVAFTQPSRYSHQISGTSLRDHQVIRDRDLRRRVPLRLPRVVGMRERMQQLKGIGIVVVVVIILITAGGQQAAWSCTACIVVVVCLEGVLFILLLRIKFLVAAAAYYTCLLLSLSFVCWCYYSLSFVCCWRAFMCVPSVMLRWLHRYRNLIMWQHFVAGLSVCLIVAFPLEHTCHFCCTCRANCSCCCCRC